MKTDSDRTKNRTMIRIYVLRNCFFFEHTMSVLPFLLFFFLVFGIVICTSCMYLVRRMRFVDRRIPQLSSSLRRIPLALITCIMGWVTVFNLICGSSQHTFVDCSPRPINTNKRCQWTLFQPFYFESVGPHLVVQSFCCSSSDICHCRPCLQVSTTFSFRDGKRKKKEGSQQLKLS